MPRRRFLFDTPDRFVAGTVGEPGNRTFFLQARDGSRIVSVALEKVQVAVARPAARRPARRAGAARDRGRRGPAGRPAGRRALDEPINEAFRVGILSMGWDTADELVLVEAREITEADDEDEETEPEGFDDEDEDGPDLLRVRLSPATPRGVHRPGAAAVGAGRPPCPLCGQPLDPQGHLCPRRNGHASSTDGAHRWTSAPTTIRSSSTSTTGAPDAFAESTRTRT